MTANAKRARGRPTTDEACEAYVEARRAGMTERGAAAKAGVSRDAVRSHPTYGPLAEAAHEEYLETHRANVDGIARGEVEDPQQGRVMFAAASWVLGKRDRENFGEHTRADVHVTGTSDETAAKLAAAISAAKKDP